MIKSRNRGKNAASYEDDPSEIKIDHNSGMPRAAVKKRKTLKTVEDSEPAEEKKSLALDGRPERVKKRRAKTQEVEPVARPGKTSVAGAKRKAARLKATIPTEEELLADLDLE